MPNLSLENWILGSQENKTISSLFGSNDFSIFHPWRSCLYLLANILNIELESGDSYQVESKFIVDLIYARKFKKIWNFDKKIWNFDKKIWNFDKKQVEKNDICSNSAYKSWKNHLIFSQNFVKLFSFETELKTMMDFTLFDTNPMILAQFI